MAAGASAVLLDRRPLTPQQPDAAPVERLAPDNRQEPRAKCGVAAETRQLLPGDDKGLLGRVLGVFPGAECRQGGAIHDALVHADQGAKGVLVPGPRGRDERRDFRGFPAFVHLRLAGGKRHEGGDGNRHWDSRHQGGLSGWEIPMLGAGC